MLTDSRPWPWSRTVSRMASTSSGAATSSSVSSKLRLQWHDHGSDLLELSKHLCGRNELTDVSLACADGEIFSAHRMVLASASSYFRKIFLTLDGGWKQPVVFLRGVSAEQMEYFLQFIYFGEANVPSAELEDLIAIAKELAIKGEVLKN